MSDIKYGLISKTDSETLIKCIDTVVKTFSDKWLFTSEIGVNEGSTSEFIKQYINVCGRYNQHFGVDNGQDFKEDELKLKMWGKDTLMYYDDSIQASCHFPDNNLHFCFIDANHSFHRVISDFVAYAPKVKVGGVLAFHDTNPKIKSFKDYQQVGNKEDERMYIQVRPALEAIGLFDNAFPEWELLYDIWDEKNEASGITAFKKLY